MKGQSAVEFSIVTATIIIFGIMLVALLGAPIQKVIKQQQSAITAVIPDTLSSVPLTDHASKQHVEQSYNAYNLPAMWDNNTCLHKNISVCPDEETIKFLCEIRPDFWGAIVVSTRDPDAPVIVTAYSGSAAYWEGNIKNCIPLAMP